MNLVTLIGNVGRDPDVRYTSTGDPVANLTLATTERWKSKDGEKREETEWHRVTFFGGVAKIVKDFVTKGQRIAITGKIHYSKYTDKDGNERHGVEIQVNQRGTLELLTSRKEREEAQEQPKEKFEATDDDVPF